MRRPDSIPNEIEQARQRLEDWRKTRVGRARIPQNEWAAAVELARQYGACYTAKVLRLSYKKLKRLVEHYSVEHQTGQQELVKKKLGNSAVPASLLAPATFMELIAPQATSICECSVELEGPRGKMRIQIKGTMLPDLAALGRALWDDQVETSPTCR